MSFHFSSTSWLLIDKRLSAIYKNKSSLNHYRMNKTNNSNSPKSILQKRSGNVYCFGQMRYINAPRKMSAMHNEQQEYKYFESKLGKLRDKDSKCTMCGKDARRDSIQCSLCKHWYHLDCVCVSQKKHLTKWNKASNLWICFACEAAIDNFDSQFYPNHIETDDLNKVECKCNCHNGNNKKANNISNSNNSNNNNNNINDKRLVLIENDTTMAYKCSLCLQLIPKHNKIAVCSKANCLSSQEAEPYTVCLWCVGWMSQMKTRNRVTNKNGIRNNY